MCAEGAGPIVNFFFILSYRMSIGINLIDGPFVLWQICDFMLKISYHIFIPNNINVN